MAKKILTILFILSCLLAVYFFGFSDYVNTDRCLDAGGKWDYDKQACIMSQ